MLDTNGLIVRSEPAERKITNLKTSESVDIYISHCSVHRRLFKYEIRTFNPFSTNIELFLFTNINKGITVQDISLDECPQGTNNFNWVKRRVNGQFLFFM